ncbi:ImmA/IrrE family metallo-endopeptidase [Paraburkholderia nemoris]|uniref:ImmA/IrrE family metallo-endopeptidase n=1 Tax=Paraburkholderia nemoris TaxID=2793076 RepID=UPI001B26A1AA|nr:ImmA/IrrE family metallo-endopeptidase [Paraburkholderia nemoris]CAE6773616.1 hypothetical protein R75777_04016 [Paraburkholderia nemoris]
MSNVSAKTIYDNLKGFGLTRAQVRALLPVWWATDAEKSPDGIAELCVLISRRLGLDLAALMQGQVRPRASTGSVAYKHRVDVASDSLQAATAIASSLARAVVAAFPTPYNARFTDAAGVAAMAREVGNGLVGLSSLIDACWNLGVPVLPLPNLPVGVRKMDGAVMVIDDRPVIIVSKKKSSRAWLAFIVAHEIGHIASGHLARAGSIVDVSLQEHSEYEAESTKDIQEQEADRFALSIFGGDDVERIVSAWPSWASAVEIAVKSREAARDLGIESGHLVLRYAFLSRRWPESMAALRYLSEDSDAEAIMRTALQRNLDLDRVSDDMQDLVCRITGIEAS